MCGRITQIWSEEQVAMKKILHTVLQLSFKEYVQSWVELIYEFYQQGVCDESLRRELDLKGDANLQFSLEYATVLLQIAVLSFEAKPKLVTDKVKKKLLDQIVEGTFRRTHASDDNETLAVCVSFYQAKYQTFSQVCKNLSSTDEKKRQTDLVGFARYLVAQVSSRSEEDNIKAVEKLGILLSMASDAYMKLLNSSAQDTGRLDGTCNFTVHKG